MLVLQGAWGARYKGHMIMDLISRNTLAQFLASEFMNPDSDFQVELQGSAAAILAHAGPEITHFLHSDHESGSDIDLSNHNAPWKDHPDNKDSKDLVSGETGNGYWMCSYSVEGGMAQYYIGVGGSPMNGAVGFLLTPFACDVWS